MWAGSDEDRGCAGEGVMKWLRVLAISIIPAFVTVPLSLAYEYPTWINFFIGVGWMMLMLNIKSVARWMEGA